VWQVEPVTRTVASRSDGQFTLSGLSSFCIPGTTRRPVLANDPSAAHPGHSGSHVLALLRLGGRAFGLYHGDQIYDVADLQLVFGTQRLYSG
jgi:hypothetical protein